MKVLVTGAAGCIGRATVARLAAAGHVVRAVDRVAGAAAPGVEWVVRDLSAADPAALAAGCDAVVHLAALVHRPDVRDPAAYRHANVELTARLLAAARKAGVQAARFLFSSTVGVYGRDHDLAADEDTPVDPRTPYARSKLEAERAVLDAGGTVLRFPVAYGPGDRGNVAQLTRAIARGRFVLPGACEAKRSLIASDNAAAAFARALAAPAPAGLYLVTDDDDRSVRALAEAIGRALTPPVEVRTVPLPPVALVASLGTLAGRFGLRTRVDLDALRKLTTRLTFSCARAKQAFGYAPAARFEDAIVAAVKDLAGRA
jgi:nucleoside-diphosphate-sugar epimerase